MSVLLVLRVAPGSSKQRLERDQSGVIKCFLHSKPEGGKANCELVDFLADMLDMPKRNIQIISGTTTRIKRIEITTQLTNDEIEKRLGI